MRLIGTIENHPLAVAFSLFLKQKGIVNELEMSTNLDWGSPDYGITKSTVWIENEDQLEDSLKWYNLFMENPYDPIFNVSKINTNINPIKNTTDPISSQSQPYYKKSFSAMGPLTRIILIGCCLLFFMSQLITTPTEIPANYPGKPIFSSPVEKVILFDYPFTYQLIDRLITLYGYEGLQDEKTLPTEGQLLYQKIERTPFWQGLYHVIIKDGFAGVPKAFQTTPMFEKIKEGEIWRLITPIFFHADLFHLFFNMLWLIVLGKQIEQRLGGFRYILFIVIIGILSNILQYIMSGPNFVGFSGVLCGMLTFIWIRQKKAPWEGYQLDRATIIFMLIFIFSMAAIQFFSFILEKSLEITISPGIANVAHLSGALLGVILGWVNIFSWRSSYDS